MCLAIFWVVTKNKDIKRYNRSLTEEIKWNTKKKKKIDCYKGGASQIAQDVKNPHINAGDTKDAGSIPGSGRSPFQYSCLENSMGRGTWWATVHGATKS